MRHLKEKIVENCKLYYQSEERNRISDDRALPLPNNATYEVRTGSSDITNKVDIVMSYQRVDEDGAFNGRLLITKNRLSGRLATGNNSIGLMYSERTKRIFSESSGVKTYGWERPDEVYDDIEEII